MSKKAKRRYKVSISLSLEQYEALEKHVENLPINRAEYVRQLLVDAIPDLPDNLARKTVTWNGITYSNNKEAQEALGVSNSTLWRWLKAGYTCDDDVQNGISKRRLYRVNGTIYQTQQEIANAYGVTQAIVSVWVKYGTTVHDIEIVTAQEVEDDNE